MNPRILQTGFSKVNSRGFFACHTQLSPICSTHHSRARFLGYTSESQTSLERPFFCIIYNINWAGCLHEQIYVGIRYFLEKIYTSQAHIYIFIQRVFVQVCHRSFSPQVILHNSVNAGLKCIFPLPERKISPAAGVVYFIPPQLYLNRLQRYSIS